MTTDATPPTPATDDFTPENPMFWRVRYQNRRMPWDLDQPAPPFVNLLEQERALLKPGKMAVLGSGSGHDAAFFGQHGFDVTGFDFAPEAVETATARYGHNARFVLADIFNLDPQYAGAFDFVLEHTCFCAIPVEKRREYVNVVNRLLKPGGLFIGLLWAHREEGGPPFRTDVREIEDLFSPAFYLRHLEITPHSVEERRGEELLALFIKKPAD